MWAKENTEGRPKQMKLQLPRHRKTEQFNRVLWAQIFICILLFAAAICVKYMNLPAYEYFDECYRKSMENSAAAQEEELLRFAISVFQGFFESAEQVKAEPQSTIEEKTAGVAHAKPAKAAPEGCSLDAFVPEQKTQKPLLEMIVTSEYGWRLHPVTGKADFHTGIDLSAAEGTGVYAVVSGYVRVAGYNAEYGNWLRIMDKNGIETLYAHLQYLFVSPGQCVAQNSLLGTVGQTGDATGPHLHFELLRQNIRYDPTEALGI